MSPAFTLDLATEADDAALRELTREVQMESRSIRVEYHREPSFFHGLHVEGTFRQVIVAREEGASGLAGCGVRTTRPAWVNGEEREVGYLGGLRIPPRFRGGTIIARAYRRLRRCHGDGRTPLYVTAILEENRAAMELLTSGRATLPTYRDAGRYLCTAVLLRRGARPPRGLAIERGARETLPEIVACLRRNGARRQFAPAWTEEDFAPDNPLTRDFSVEDFFVARRGGRVVGVVGKWDQSSFKQSILGGYGGGMRVARRLWDLAAPVIGCRRLPRPGELIPFFFAAFVAVDEDDEEVFRGLLRALRHEYRRSDYSFFVVGLHERDPLLAVAREPWLRLTYASRLFVVFWDDGKEAAGELDGRVPYQEAATL